MGIEASDVGGWLTHVVFAMGIAADFLAIGEHRLISALGSRLRAAGDPHGLGSSFLK